jgi:hypothetical protein
MQRIGKFETANAGKPLIRNRDAQETSTSKTRIPSCQFVVIRGLENKWRSCKEPWAKLLVIIG